MGKNKLAAGGDFGDYRIVRLLATNSKSDVYLVKSSSTGELCALKLFLPSGKDLTDDVKERFAAAGEAAAAIGGDGIAEFRDFGVDPETNLLYVLTPYMAGGTLAARIAKDAAPMPIPAALALGSALARALARIHAAGTIHGNLSPDNVLLDGAGAPRLALANSAAISGEALSPYSAPEQITRETQPDARTDVFALGAILYELISGVQPPAPASMPETIVKMERGEIMPDIRSARPGTPDTIATLVSALCASKPADRPQSASEAAEYIETLARTIQYSDAPGGSGKAPAPAHHAAKKRVVKLPTAQLPQAGEVFARKEGSGKASLFLTFLALAGVVGCALGAHFLLNRLKEREPAPEPNYAITDSTVRSAAIGASTWFYTLSQSQAILWQGIAGLHGPQCVEPEPSGHVVVPGSVGGFPVVELGPHAFHRSRLETIALPDSLEKIGDRAFLDCTELKEISFGPKVAAIGLWSFNNCTALKRVNLAMCSAIIHGGGAFAFCPAIEEYTVSPGNTAFKTIDGALLSANGRRLVAVPAAKKFFVIPDGVETIGDYAFCNSSVAELAIPESVKEIGTGAFSHCKALRKISFAGDAPLLGDDAAILFRSARRDIEIVVKDGAYGWPSDFWPENGGRKVVVANSASQAKPGREIIREWTERKSGKSRAAALCGISEDRKVVFLRYPGDEQLKKLTISRLTDEDQEFIAARASSLPVIQQ